MLTEFEGKIKFNSRMAVTKCHYHGRTYTLPYQKTISLQHRLQQQPALLKEYDAIIRDQVKQVVEVVTDPTPTDGRVVHYLPHYAVKRQDEATTKMRIVYDASAKMTGPVQMTASTRVPNLIRELWTSY